MKPIFITIAILALLGTLLYHNSLKTDEEEIIAALRKALALYQVPAERSNISNCMLSEININNEENTIIIEYAYSNPFTSKWIPGPILYFSNLDPSLTVTPNYIYFRCGSNGYEIFKFRKE